MALTGCKSGKASVSTPDDGVNIVIPDKASNRIEFAGERLMKVLTDEGYKATLYTSNDRIDTTKVCIYLTQASDTTGLKKEGFTITTNGKRTTVVGNDGSGVIYGSCSWPIM
jgi:hypothetical protein